MKGVWLRRCALIGIVSCRLGVAPAVLAVAHHMTTAGASDVTVNAPTFVGNAGNVFPATMVSLFFVEVALRTAFLDILLTTGRRRAGRVERLTRVLRRPPVLRNVLRVERLLLTKRRGAILGGKSRRETRALVDNLAQGVVETGVASRHGCRSREGGGGGIYRDEVSLRPWAITLVCPGTR